MPRLIAIVMIAAMVAANGQVYISQPQALSVAGVVACDNSAVLSMSTATTTQAIALASGKSVYVCGFVLNAGGTATVKLVQGTGSNCGSGQSNLTPAFNLTAGGNVALGNSLGRLLKSNSGSAVCVKSSAAQPVNVLLIYTQF